jgi:pyruvate dehydrogenase E1 component
MRTRGFLLGGTAGRTTLSGEGLQHQDGHSHLLAHSVPNLKAYDPAYGYELAVIIRDGMRRMFENQEDVFYYLTVMNEPYPMPAMPEGVEEGILKGIYKFAACDPAAVPDKKPAPACKAHLFGSGAILNEAVKAQKILAERYGVSADVWSVTSYKELYTDAMACERKNLLESTNEPAVPHLTSVLSEESGVFVAASDYVRMLPDSLARWIPGRLVTLGTDGFGRSDSREALRNFFEVDARYIALGALKGLAAENAIDASVAERAIEELNIDPNKLDPLTA